MRFPRLLWDRPARSFAKGVQVECPFDVHDRTAPLGEVFAVSPRPPLFIVEMAGAMQSIVHALVVPPFVRMIDLSYVGVVGGSEKVDLGRGIAEMIHDASVEPGELETSVCAGEKD